MCCLHEGYWCCLTCYVLSASLLAIDRSNRGPFEAKPLLVTFRSNYTHTAHTLASAGICTCTHTYHTHTHLLYMCTHTHTHTYIYISAVVLAARAPKLPGRLQSAAGPNVLLSQGPSQPTLHDLKQHVPMHMHTQTFTLTCMDTSTHIHAHAHLHLHTTAYFVSSVSHAWHSTGFKRCSSPGPCTQRPRWCPPPPWSTLAESQSVRSTTATS